MRKTVSPSRAYPVPRLWPGETVVCLASGPSLTREDVDVVRGRAKTIVINTTYTLAPWADLLYAADARWWNWFKGAPDFPGLKYAITALSARWPDVKVLGKGPSNGLSLDPTKIALGGNSGYQAINVAVLMGAARILLLGYDMRVGPRDRQHWHADHPMKQRSPYQNFQRAYPTLVEPLRRAGVEIVNCSRDTALTCFRRQPIEEALDARESVSDARPDVWSEAAL